MGREKIRAPAFMVMTKTLCAWPPHSPDPTLPLLWLGVGVQGTTSTFPWRVLPILKGCRARDCLSSRDEEGTRVPGNGGEQDRPQRPPGRRGPGNREGRGTQDWLRVSRSLAGGALPRLPGFGL